MTTVDEAREALLPHVADMWHPKVDALIAAVRAERINVTDCHEAGRMAGRAESAETLAALRNTVALLDSMVRSGEKHSPASEAVVRFALAATPPVGRTWAQILATPHEEQDAATPAEEEL